MLVLLKQVLIIIINHQKRSFFDWLVCSIKSINEILEKKPILFGNIIYPNSSNTVSINFSNFDKLISHHDIHEFNDNSIIEITEKYNRRYERLIYTLINKKSIFFIRYCKKLNDIEEEQILIFIQHIKNNNTNLLFKFILISDYDNIIIPNSLINNEYFIFINLNNYIDEEVLNETNKYFKIIKKYKCIFKYNFFVL